jgi:Ca2+-binding RTX toxin-like protein
VANIINGNAGDNILTGGAGIDTLKGNGGDDTYIVNVNSTTGLLEDTVTAGTGTDTLKLVGNYTGAAKNLVAANTIENFDISGTTSTSLLNVNGNLNVNFLTGNDAANTLKGLVGDDHLFGGGDDDVLVGGLGVDTLTGDAGADTFWFDQTSVGGVNADLIIDFSHSEHDVLKFSKVAGGLSTIGATGFFSAADARFEANATGTATTAAARLIYNTTNGELSYDSNGNGVGGAVVLETLGIGTHPTVTASDIWIV